MATAPGIVGGVPISITRQKTSKTRLKIRWEYPVYKPPAIEALPWETVSVAGDRPLGRGAAFAYIAGDDPRPLLVLRECERCTGTEVALLSRTAENDRTLLLARWFHCVKLPPDVLRPNHPFRNLFPAESAPHLFLARADGSDLVPLSGAQSQGDLWDAMYRTLRLAYDRDPEGAVGEILKLLAHYDALDAQIALLEDRLDEEIERNGPDTVKVRSLRKEIEKLQKQREQALAREAEIADLKLRPAEPAGTVAAG